MYQIIVPESLSKHTLENRLLLSLSDVVHQRLLPRSKLIYLAQGQTIYDAGAYVESVYFPFNSVISLIFTTENGATGEMGLVGNDGAVGVSQILGKHTPACCSAIVQVAGAAMRMKAGAFLEEFHRDGTFQQAILQYIQTFIIQISQIALCNSLHSVEQRLILRLLMTWDRIHGDNFPMTQDCIASMLGVRRASVTHAACHLQTDGLIHYWRGNIRLLNRQGLEAFACECYRILKQPCPKIQTQQRFSR